MPPPPPPPELSDDLLGEAFLRLPADDPACLLRTSLACKRWRRVLADPAFRRRHRELHRSPSVLGFLQIVEEDGPYVSRFVPNTTTTSGCPAARDLPNRLVLDCRHGRVLFLAPSRNLDTQIDYDLVVWDPLTNKERCLPSLSPTNICAERRFNAAVLCSAPAEGCDHSNCHGGQFRVAFVWSHTSGHFLLFAASARVYSSETGNWSEAISVDLSLFVLDRMPCPSTLVGDTLYFRFDSAHALEYQLGTQRLSIIHGPPTVGVQNRFKSLMSMENGGLGCLSVEEDESSLCLRLWSREAASCSDGDAGWTRGRAIDLEKLLPDGALPSPRWWAANQYDRRLSIRVLGFVEGSDVIFLGTVSSNHPGAVYMVEFNSGRSRKLFDQWTVVFPYTSFCIPAIDASCTTEGPGDGGSVTDASSATEVWARRIGDNASGA